MLRATAISTLLLAPSLALSSLAATKIYWSETRNNLSEGYIMRADADGSNVTELVSGAQNIIGPNGLEYGNGRLFWPDQQLHTIKSVLPNGQSVSTFALASNPYDVFVGERIYWCSFTGNYIYGADLSGANNSIIFSGSSVTRPVALAVSGTNLYWAELTGNGRIQRSELSGADITTLVTNVAPYDIQIVGDKIYLGDTGTSLIAAGIRRVNLDGTGLTTLISGSENVGLPHGIWVGADGIYWADNGLHAIRKVGLDGQNMVTLVSRPDGDVRGVVVLDDTTPTACGTISEAALRGQTVTYGIEAGAAPYATSGSYRVQFASTGNTFTVLDSLGASVTGAATGGTWSFGADLGISTVVTLAFTGGGTEKIAMLSDCFFERYKDGQVSDQTGHYSGAAPAPSFTQQPLGRTVVSGTAVTFSATASGASPTYQWFKDGSPVAGATSSSLTVTADSTTYGVYTVVATAGGVSLASSEAPLSILNPLSGVLQLPVGGQLSLNSGLVSANPSATYQWYKDGAPVLTATSASFSKTSLTTSDAGNYTVVVRAGGILGTNTVAAVTVTAPVEATYNSKSFSRLVNRTDATNFYSNRNFSDYLAVSLKDKVVTFLSPAGGGDSSPRGVFTYSEAEGLKKRVDITSPIPGGTGNFTGFSSATPSSSGAFYFTGLGASQYGVYSYDNGTVTKLYNTTTNIPNKSTTFGDFNSVRITSTGLAFAAGRIGAGAFRGVYRSSGGTLTPVADFDAVAPPGSNKYVGFDNVIAASGSSIVFFATEGGTFKSGLYASMNGGAVQRLANTDTIFSGVTVPMGSGSFPVIANGKIGFIATSGLIYGAPGSLQAIAQRGSTLGGRLVPITAFYGTGGVGLSAESDGVYFTVLGGDAYTGVFRYQNGAISKVIDSLDSIGGQPLRMVRLGASQGDDVVVITQFYDGKLGLWGNILQNVAATPTITQDPINVTVTAGQPATFTVAAGGAAPLTYIWKKNGTEVVGGNSPTLTLDNVQAGNAGSYACTVTNSAGSATSGSATLTVNPLIIAPTIAQGPASQTVSVGTSVTFSVTANGTAPFTFLWYKGTNSISTATSSSYTISSPQLADAGQYHVVVSNSAGLAESGSATLTVNAVVVAPTVAQGPVSQTVTAGTPVTFRVTANGTAPFTYQWFKGTDPIGAATAATYTISSPQTVDAGSYHVRVINSAGFADSGAATLTVNAAPTAPSITQGPQSQTVTVGSPVTFTVVASGTDPLSYLWFKGTNAISTATASSYTISNPQTTDSGTYHVRVTNSAGAAESGNATLTVNPAATAVTIAQQPQNLTVTNGGTATFMVIASGTPPYTYQWFKGADAIQNATNAVFTIQPLQPGDSGSYSVIVSNSVSNIRSDIVTLTVSNITGGPQIVQPPGNQAVSVGDSVVFTVLATGNAPLGYQWRKNGTNIANATGSALVLQNIQLTDAGAYSVFITNAIGTATSASATLLVTPATDRALTLYDVHITGDSKIAARVGIHAIGNENQIRFTIVYNTNRLSNPVVFGIFEPTTSVGSGEVINNPPPPPPFVAFSKKEKESPAQNLPLDAGVFSDSVTNGQVSVMITLSPGETLQAGDQEIIVFNFTPAPGTTPEQAGLAFAAAPIIKSAGGDILTAKAVTAPNAGAGVISTTANPQNGYFTQSFTLSNPSAGDYPGVRVFVQNLPPDTATNIVRLANGLGTNGAPLLGLPYFDFGVIAAGASVTFNVEYYVSNRRTPPSPTYTVFVQPPPELPLANAFVVATNATRMTNGLFLAEFKSEGGRTYYVQYNSSVTATNGWKTSLPSVRGTGAFVQWIDTGPPRTESHPTNAPARFYRVLALP